jgi:hypothetical protein
MNLLLLFYDLVLASRTDRSGISEGSSTGMQVAGLAMFGIGGILLLFAIVALYHP